MAALLFKPAILARRFRAIVLRFRGLKVARPHLSFALM